MVKAGIVAILMLWCGFVTSAQSARQTDIPLEKKRPTVEARKHRPMLIEALIKRDPRIATELRRLQAGKPESKEK